ncbi:MAG: hypothetical protein P8M30_02695, partial [Planctomycetaceae bacterium]|nr:hypothetical protein [Planctomycetaceae bacterium]
STRLAHLLAWAFAHLVRSVHRDATGGNRGASSGSGERDTDREQGIVRGGHGGCHGRSNLVGFPSIDNSKRLKWYRNSRLTIT